MKNLNDLFQDTIRDIYNSEQQLLKAMPKMREKAQDPRLKKAFEDHIEQTHEHVSRIEQICSSLGFQPTGKICNGTVGLVKEADEEMGEYAGSPAGDACIIACAQKAEHYEISNYGTVICWAEDLELDNEIVDLLELTLKEEEEADDMLSMIADEKANPAALRAWRESPAGKASVI